MTTQENRSDLISCPLVPPVENFMPKRIEIKHDKKFPVVFVRYDLLVTTPSGEEAALECSKSIPVQLIRVDEEADDLITMLETRMRKFLAIYMHDIELQKVVNVSAITRLSKGDYKTYYNTRNSSPTDRISLPSMEGLKRPEYCRDVTDKQEQELSAAWNEIRDEIYPAIVAHEFVMLESAEVEF